MAQYLDFYFIYLFISKSLIYKEAYYVRLEALNTSTDM